MSKVLYTEKEAQEYFDHNPNAHAVGFAMLEQEQVQQAENGDEIQGNVDVIEVVVNPDIEQVIKREYQSNK